MPAISFIGATMGCVQATPATIDSAGFGALTYIPIGKIQSIGEVGDSSADVAIELLEGRTEHVNGVKDGGEINVAVRYEATDAGQIIIAAQNNTNNTVSFKITDPDGKLAYFHGVVSSHRDVGRTASQHKGTTFIIRVNSATIRV